MEMTQEELNQKLELHELWLEDKQEGVRLDLSFQNLEGASLEGANLRSAILRSANLRSANLTDANLTCANLTGANLTGANLRSANLTDANLLDANLRRANLYYANLTRADLDYSCWPLWCGSLGVKADEALVGQLAFHMWDLAKSSGIEIKSIKQLKDLINKSSPVVKHNKEKVC